VAIDKAVVNISASLLPDEIKTSVGANIVYDLNDVGNNNKWIYSLTIINNANEDAILASIPFLGQGTTEQGSTATSNGTDDVVFFFIKHTGTRDGSTSSSDKLFLNLSGGDPSSGGSVGDIIIEPNECFFARLSNTEIDDINVEADGSSNIQAMVFAIIDDGGV
jgi:hypothetical protein|tara:strand:+ start:1596 stop:2087 length:492 start_codon:yes stop_codon:yes gene_type:complete